jgi:AI-2 transport protein TqsA
MIPPGGYQRPLIAVILIILLLAGLRATSAVTMPLAFALFLLALAWPMERAFERRTPRKLSLALTLLMVLLVLAFFSGLVYLCVISVIAKAPEYESRFQNLFESFQQWGERSIIPIETARFDPDRLAENLVAWTAAFFWAVIQLAGLVVMIAAYFVLGLLEVNKYQHNLETRIGTAAARKLLVATEEMTINFQRFMLTRTLISAITGILVGLYTWAIGLDFPLIWGLISFVLNYIPVLGSIVAVVPPTLLAFIQWDSPWLGGVTLGGLTVIQFIMGNYVEPRTQGRFLQFSPLLLFFSLVFWGWVWGIPGALLGVPLTLSILIFCRHFEGTKWISELFAR